MTVYLSPVGGVAQQFFNDNGAPLSGGKLYTYAAGTTAPQPCYTDATGITPHSNPIILNSAGRVPGGEIWLSNTLSYKFVLETSSGTLLGTYDNIVGINSSGATLGEVEFATAIEGQTVFTLTSMSYTAGNNTLSVFVDGLKQYVGQSYTETNATTVTFTEGLHAGALVAFYAVTETSTPAIPASLVTYTYPASGAQLETVQDKLDELVFASDFGAVGDGIVDDAAAISNARATGKIVVFASGTYAVSTFGSGVFRCASTGTTEIKFSSGVVSFSGEVTLDCAFGDITLAGDMRETVAITANSTPSVNAVNISGYLYYYDVTFACVSTGSIVAGDYVGVSVSGPPISVSPATNYDMTRDGVRSYELQGAARVQNVVPNTSITVRLYNQNSSSEFPTGSSIKVLSGSIIKWPTVLSFTDCDGICSSGRAVKLENLAIVGNRGGTAKNGVKVSSVASNPANVRDCSLAAENLLLHGFSGDGIHVNGANSSAVFTSCFTSYNLRHGVYVGNGARAEVSTTIASGNGGTTYVGHGFFCTRSSSINCGFSQAVGNSYSGFICDRNSVMTAEDTVSMGNGNLARENATGNTAQEGKGYEAENNGFIMARRGVACFNVSYGFDAIINGLLSADYAVACNNSIRHGFVCAHASSVYARFSVANDNGLLAPGEGGSGFYAWKTSQIDAENTFASGNDYTDYRGRSLGRIYCEDFQNVSSTFDPPENFMLAGSAISSQGDDTVVVSNPVISAGTLTVPAWATYIKVSTGGAAANLDNILGGVADGQRIILRSAAPGPNGTVTIRHNAGGTGNIRTLDTNPYVLDPTTDKTELVYDLNADTWFMISYASYL